MLAVGPMHNICFLEGCYYSEPLGAIIWNNAIGDRREWAAGAVSGGFGPRIALLIRLFGKSNKSRHEKTGGVKGRDRSAEELDRETGEEQTTVGRTRRMDGGWHTTDESGGVTWAGQEETSEAKAEMGGLC